eukprot:TRINITY_DN780032_c0_g1_i1.p1 TRINITY_DN780032_c0_g1~~TRINITY_DN780032_c0_g1_i1.p1  ORF type:complete len:231 (+),score=68.93 TRINITY_DN780032_c0_g1_i1:57-695(+)
MSTDLERLFQKQQVFPNFQKKSAENDKSPEKKADLTNNPFKALVDDDEETGKAKTAVNPFNFGSGILGGGSKPQLVKPEEQSLFSAAAGADDISLESMISGLTNSKKESDMKPKTNWDLSSIFEAAENKKSKIKQQTFVDRTNENKHFISEAMKDLEKHHVGKSKKQLSKKARLRKEKSRLKGEMANDKMNTKLRVSGSASRRNRRRQNKPI